MRVLVTGGAGFIGSYVVLDLIRTGHEVVAYDIKVAENSLDHVLNESEHRQVNLVAGNVTDAEKLTETIAAFNVDSIAHLASPLTQQTEGAPEFAIHNMIQGQQIVLEAARAANLKKVVWASSVGVYGPAKLYPNLPLPNDAPHYPVSLYGACKSFNEYLSTYYTEKYGLDTLGLRFPLVYGVGRLRGNGLYFVDLFEKPALGQPCRVPLADAVYDWLYVVDAAQLVVRALGVSQTRTRCFNVGGEFAPMRKAVALIRKWIPDAVFEMEPGEYPIVEEYDCSALEEEVGFIPCWSLESGLRKSLDLVRERVGLPTLK